MTKSEKSRKMCWRKPALAELSYREIVDKLTEIYEECSDIRWTVQDNDMLIDALDGNEEEAFEFKMLFSDLESEAYELSEQLNELFRYEHNKEQKFNDCTVAMIGDRFKVVGYDSVEEDYFSLTSYTEGLAISEAGKRIMRLTKKEMLYDIGQCLGIILAFYNVEMKYEYLRATFDILQDKNTSAIEVIKNINTAYERANEVDFNSWENATKELDEFIRTLSEMTDRLWVE